MSVVRRVLSYIEPIGLVCLLCLTLLLVVLLLSGQVSPVTVAPVKGDLRQLVPRAVLDGRLSALEVPYFEAKGMLTLIQDTIDAVEQRLETTVTHVGDYTSKQSVSTLVSAAVAECQAITRAGILSTQINQYNLLHKATDSSKVWIKLSMRSKTAYMPSRYLTFVTAPDIRMDAIVLAKSEHYYLAVKDSQVMAFTIAGDRQVGRWTGPRPWLGVYRIPPVDELVRLITYPSAYTWAHDTVASDMAPYVYKTQFHVSI